MTTIDDVRTAHMTEGPTFASYIKNRYAFKNWKFMVVLYWSITNFKVMQQRIERYCKILSGDH